ncbi:MAG TPA: serpin family protein, partial [Actinobacteria bacterium]|nr:serpin family protein [Actinomycetota bacterium]
MKGKLFSSVLAVALVASACGGAEPSPPAAMAMSNLPRAAGEVSPGDMASVASGMEAFGTDLYAMLATGDGNLVFSPASIVTALAMTYAGARGVTAEEMARVLHVDLNDEAFHQAMNALDLALESRSFTEGDEGVQLSTANSLWGQQGLTFEQPFLDTLGTDYGSGMRLVDFKAAAEQARVRINEWVASETNDNILDLIPQGALDSLTRLVLVNAVYLDATWEHQFDPNETADGPFTLLDGSRVNVPMMHQTSSFSYGTGDGWQAVQMPYVGDDLAMLVVVPDEGRFTDVEGRLARGLLDDAVASLFGAQSSVSLTIPRFEFRTQAGLNTALRDLGMRTAFDRDAADFSGMTTEETLYISDVVHEAYIAVDEEGTEAAAATGVVMRTTSAPLEEVRLTIDRPFIFALRDVPTGALL